MGKQSSRKKSNSKGSMSLKDKGNIVEQIAASMHEYPGVKVERNVFLPPIVGGNNRKKREIDVLLTQTVAGYPVRIAIECKNEKEAIGVEKMDAFVGKLQDVGIPTQHGIYISANGYTIGAIERAKVSGIRPLILRGLTKEGLSATIADAFQSVVYLLLQVLQIEMITDFPPPVDQQLLFLFDNAGNVKFSIPDLIWQEWRAGRLESLIGEYEMNLAIPDDCHQIVNEKIVTCTSIKAKVRILGLVVTLQGQASEHVLVNASDETVERGQLNLSFDTSQDKPSVTVIATESQLQDFIRRPGAFHLTIQRLRLPRIMYGSTYWPPSERAMNKMIERMRAFANGEIPDPRPFAFSDIEGTDLETVLEPPLKGHPAAKEWNNLLSVASKSEKG